MPEAAENLEYLIQHNLHEIAPEHLLGKLAGIATRTAVSAGETLFKKGDMGSAMYFVMDGRLRVHDGDLALNSLGAGEMLGEIAGLGAVERTATVTAETDAVLMKFEAADIFTLMSGDPPATKALIEMLCAREGSIADQFTARSRQVRALERELEIGRQIQAGFLPESMPEIEGWEAAAHFQAAHEVAGDFYDGFRISSLDRVGLVIGDVCDKGVGAALFMTLFRSLLRAAALSGDFESWSGSPAPVADAADRDAACRDTLMKSIVLTNNYVARTHGKTSMFASVFFGLLDPASGRLDYINAGHESPVVFDASGVKHRLEPTGPVIGIFAGANYEIGSTQLAPGDTMLTFTDGVTEAAREDGSQFSEDRLLPMLGGAGHSAQALLGDVVGAVKAFTAGADQSDDITMLAVRHLV